MSGLLAKMAARMGVSLEDARAVAAVGAWGGLRKLMKPVPDTPEVARVVALPRRNWEELEDWVMTEMTNWLKLPGGQQELRKLQAAFLADLHDYRGALGAIRVGGGKTHLSFLAPIVCDAQRPLLIVPGKLLKKTEREHEEIALHWRRHPRLEVVSYEKLGRQSGARLLESFLPDMIFCDEVQKLKDREISVTKRVERYMEWNAGRVIFAGVSGTVTKFSIMDFHHLLRWTHGPERMPMPYTHDESRIWALALDPRVSTERRPMAGALVRLLPEGESLTDDVEALRTAFGERVAQTPGVISTTTAGIDAPIIVEFWSPDLPDLLLQHLERLKKDAETPNGELLESKVDVWRHARELVLGFYYRWDPPAPEEWLEPRKAWAKYVRYVLGENMSVDVSAEVWFARFGETVEDEVIKVYLDSPAQVVWAVQEGLLNDYGFLKRWLAVKDSFVPNPVPEWVTLEMLEKVKDQVDGPTLVWVEHVAIGRKLSEVTGWPYCGEGGVDQKGRPVEEYDGRETVILSIRANCEGRNLQAWNRNLVLTMPANAAQNEQLLGRTHREGQLAEEVHVRILLGHPFAIAALNKSMEEARFLQSVQGQPQKLLLADFTNELREVS